MSWIWITNCFGYLLFDREAKWQCQFRINRTICCKTIDNRLTTFPKSNYIRKISLNYHVLFLQTRVLHRQNRQNI